LDGGYSGAAQEESLRDIARRAAASRRLVADDRAIGALVGAVSLSVTLGPLTQIARPGEVEMRLLAVSPAARGRGVGAALVARCIEQARAAGCSALVPSTQPSMTAAHRLYEREGMAREESRDWLNARGLIMRVYVLPLA
jgi:GNAT superfamily N-acetyltransferase